MRTTPKTKTDNKLCDFEDHLPIDKHSLDEECVEQSSLFAKYSGQLAEAQKVYDMLKVDIDVQEAVLDTEIRADPEKFGLEKTTETCIKNKIKSQPEWMTLQLKLTEAKHKVSILQGAVRAFDQRKKMLVSLVQLHGQDYFSSVEVKGDPDFMKRAKQSIVREKIKNRKGDK